MSETLTLERVQQNLIRLKMSRIPSVLSTQIGLAQEKGQSHLAFLDELLEEEVAQKEQRRVETSLKISGLPFVKSVDEYDFTFQPTLDRQ